MTDRIDSHRRHPSLRDERFGTPEELSAEQADWHARELLEAERIESLPTPLPTAKLEERDQLVRLLDELEIPHVLTVTKNFVFAEAEPSTPGHEDCTLQFRAVERLGNWGLEVRWFCRRCQRTNPEGWWGVPGRGFIGLESRRWLEKHRDVMCRGRP